jgi:hypothetical protein
VPASKTYAGGTRLDPAEPKAKANKHKKGKQKPKEVKPRRNKATPRLLGMQPETCVRAGCRSARLRSARIALLALALAAPSTLALASCGSKKRAEGATMGTFAAIRAGSPQCSNAVALAYGQVAKHIYAEFAGGRVVLPAVRRLQRSHALVAAVQSGNPAATRAALLPLIHGQLVRVRVILGSSVLAEYGAGAEALAPVTAPLRSADGSTIATLVTSEQSVRGYVDTVASFTEAQVLVRAGSQQLGGTTTEAPATLPRSGEVPFGNRRYTVSSFSGTRFPSGSMRVYILAHVPRAAACGRTNAETVANTIGNAAMSIYRDEQSGSRARAVVRDFERSRNFQQAVASGDTPATEAAIVAFFKTRLHVVRVRATLMGKLVADVGGPHVLAPTAGKVHDSHGHVVGRFLLSVQDDQGYLILAHRFTGAQVLLRQGAQQIVGDLAPSPTRVPDRGEVVYRGIHYQAYSFIAEAFPKGPLRVSLLIPPLTET